MTSIPELASLQNRMNGRFRCSENEELRSSDSPDCLFHLEWLHDYAGGTDRYLIKNIQSNEFICQKSGTRGSEATRWKIEPTGEGGYTIQDADSGDYLSSDASGRHRGTPGRAEYWTIHSKDPASQISCWMTQNWDSLKSQRLDQICLPGSHDSGTYEEATETTYGSVRNTRTQLFDMGLQLKHGVRVFDLRPTIYKGDFHTVHYSDLAVVGYQGAVGVSLRNAFAAIELFVENDAHKNELIILNFSHFINWDRRDRQPEFTHEEKEAFNDLVQLHFSKILVCGAPDALRTSTLEGLMTPNTDRKNVIAVSTSFEPGEPRTRSGLWHASYFSTRGKFSDTDELHSMKFKQQEQLLQLRGYPRGQHGHFMFKLYWTLTLSNWDNAVKGSTSILELAEYANPDLLPTFTKWMNDDVITREHYPNVIITDACEESVTHAVDLSLRTCRLLGP